jgi:capsular polysaccharide biosynthesis protein
VVIEPATTHALRWQSIKQRVRPVAQAIARMVVDSRSDRLPPNGYIDSSVLFRTLAGQRAVEENVIYAPRVAQERPPTILECNLHKIFQDHCSWTQPKAAVYTIPGGRVWGRRGAVITSENALLGDVSREFGAFKGVYNERHSIFKQVILPKPQLKKGLIGMVSAPGARTYYHWMFDILPRIHLLQKSGMLEHLNGLVIDYEGLPFQDESLKLLHISREKLIVPTGQWNFHLRAEKLVVPTLPSEMCTIADWAVNFLRDTFLGNISQRQTRRLFISRRRAPTRTEENYDEILSLLRSMGFEEYIAEDHSIVETAADFAQAEWVIGLHGGGLANLAFASPGTKVIEFLPPNHLDPLFWILSNIRQCKHAYLFGEGERPPEDSDLVSSKSDDDVVVSPERLVRLMALLDRSG